MAYISVRSHWWIIHVLTNYGNVMEDVMWMMKTFWERLNQWRCVLWESEMHRSWMEVKVRARRVPLSRQACKGEHLLMCRSGEIQWGRVEVTCVDERMQKDSDIWCNWEESVVSWQVIEILIQIWEVIPSHYWMIFYNNTILCNSRRDTWPSW